MSYIKKVRRIREEIENKRKDSTARALGDPVFNQAEFDGQFPYELNEIKGIQQKEAVRLYLERGWVQIYSTYLKTSLYLVRNEGIRVPKNIIPKYTQKELNALRGLDLDELKTLHAAKTIFDGILEKVE